MWRVIPARITGRDGQIIPSFVIELQITNYNWHNGEITKLQISNCKLLQITNYKFRFNSLQVHVCSMEFYGNKVSHLRQNNHSCQFLMSC